jgi:hypothetical protein
MEAASMVLQTERVRNIQTSANQRSGTVVPSLYGDHLQGAVHDQERHNEQSKHSLWASHDARPVRLDRCSSHKRDREWPKPGGVLVKPIDVAEPKLSEPRRFPVPERQECQRSH